MTKNELHLFQHVLISLLHPVLINYSSIYNIDTAMRHQNPCPAFVSSSLGRE